MAKANAAGIVADGTGADDDGPVYLWPESERTWHEFMALASQWVDGVLHVADIAAHVHVVADDAADRRDLYAGLRACERAVAHVLAEHAHQRRRRDASRAM